MTMTKNTDFKLPYNSLQNYVPQNLRNPVVTSLIDNLFDRFLTHDESVPLYGYVGRKPTSPDDRAPRVPQPSVERDINSIVPVLSFKLGPDRHAFTVEDLIRKAEAIGISPGNLQWLYSQGNNYLPPINLDKFTNFFNYYWVARSLPAKPELPWNPDLSPEYYVIAAPQPSDSTKRNVLVASTKNVILTGSGFNKISFEVQFSSPTQFTVLPVGSLSGYNPVKTSFVLSSPNEHIDYYVRRDDSVVKLIEFDITRDELFDEEGNSVGYAQFSDGDKFIINPEFLTRNYTVTFAGSPGIKGKILRVKPLNVYQKIDGIQLEEGDRVLIRQNADGGEDGIYVVSPGKWERAADFNDETKTAGARVYVREGATHGGTLFVSVDARGKFSFLPDTMPAGGYQSNTNDWQEGNYWVSGDELSGLGLARADAIQAVRPIIEYAGDVQLNSFVKNGKPSDSGTAYRQIKTEFNQLPLFDLYRYDGTHAGLVSSVFYYEEDVTAELDVKLQKRVLKSTNDSADFIFNHGMADEAGQQLFIKRSGQIKSIWHAGYTEATVVGSTYGGKGNGTIEGLDAYGFTQQQVWTLTAKTETTFTVEGSKMPALPEPYNIAVVGQKYDNGEVTFTIKAGDIPFMPGDVFMFRVGNLESPRYVYRDKNDAIYDRFGGPALDLNGEGAWQIPRTFYNNPYNDGRSPVAEGVLYSHFRGILSNQIEGQPIDPSFGGSIKLWSEQQTLLASLLMQRDMTPISMIDLAQRQYETALNSARDIFEQNIAKYIGDNGPVSSYADLEKLLAFIEKIRAQDNDVRTVLYDSTSPVVGFPATLPQLGIAELVKPRVEFDPVLGAEVLIHHDGHKSALYTGSKYSDILNSLMLMVETRLYEGMNPNARKYDFDLLKDDPQFNAELKKELFAFAAMNGFDPLGSDYNAANAFTWNYSGASAEQLPVMPTGPIPARWNELLKAHQSMFDVIPTERPHLEPWKLFNEPDGTVWWNSLSPELKVAYTSVVTLEQLENGEFFNAGSVTAVQTQAGITPLMGLGMIDGVQLKSGDRVLLTNETAPENNGVWNVSASGWTRVSLEVGSYVTIVGGVYKGTKWVKTSADGFDQARLWSNKLWEDVQALNPGLRLSVDTINDTLIPPYVSPESVNAPKALVLGRPSSAALPYQFGQGSPVETAWKRSLEFGYSRARALFRYDPLAFLGFAWGFNWVEVDGVLYDGVDMQMPGHKRFRLHGDELDAIERSPLQVSGIGSLVLTYTAYSVQDGARLQNFTVSKNGKAIGYVNVGDTAQVGELTFTIRDEGRPFRLGDRFEITGGSAIFVPNLTHIYHGFGQTFTHALRETSISTQSSYAISAFREWDVNMGYRAGSLVATDDLQVYSDMETLSQSAYDLMFKKNQIARNEWIQGLRISVLNFGATIRKDIGLAPTTDGSDWMFRIEGYNPRYTAISYYDMELGENPIDFHALSKAHTDLAWFQPSKIKQVVNTNLPLTIKGIQNVVNFLFGYSKYLEGRGWEFNRPDERNIDAETGRTRNFQLEIEKFIDRCYAGIQVGQGHVVNPFMDGARYNQETGLLSEFVDTSLFDITGHPGVFDTLGVKFRKADLDVIRTNTQSIVSATAPIFSAHIQIDEFEHLFIFNYFSQPSTKSGLLYDPFSGARVTTYKFNGRKQATNNMRPEFGGHFLVGNQVHQNLQASTDNIANLYDANYAFENEVTTRHALALLGFNNKEYFNSLDISNKTQFNFWRGLIQSKGTNLSIDAYLNNNRFDDAKVDEYWAYKLAEYGDARARNYPELKLSVNDALTQFTQIQFDNESLATSGFDVVYQFDEKRWFSYEDMNQNVKFDADQVGTFHLTDAVAGQVYQLPFVADALVPGAFTKINATTVRATENGNLNVIGYGPARPHFNPVKLFNYVDNELVAEIPIWHPAAGQHTPSAMESINIISNLNPARYNYSLQALNNNTYDPLRPWGAREVGRVWFDTRNLAYLPYYDDTIFALDERLSRWGTLADYGSIDVYEWVQSSVPPSEYDALALEQQGDAGLDPLTKAAGQVADKKTYSRDRVWQIRPVAWSYSPTPKDVDWGATPPFPAGSTDAQIEFLPDLDLKIGLAVLDRGTFAEYDITAGMRIGAWNNSESDPKPLSEYIIEDRFTKVLEEASGARFTSKTVTSYLDDNGEERDVNFLVEVQPIEGVSSVTGEIVVEAVGEVTDSTDVGSNVSAFLQVRSPEGKVLDKVVVAARENVAEGSGGASATQTIRFNPDLAPSTLTGLTKDQTYTLVIEIDSETRTINFLGKDVVRVERLIKELNDEFPSQPFELVNGDIVITSPTTGAGSKVKIDEEQTTLFQTMTNFDAIMPWVKGYGDTNGDPDYMSGATVVYKAGDTANVELASVGLNVKVTALGSTSSPMLFAATSTDDEDGTTYPIDVISRVIAEALDGVVIKDAAVVTPVVESMDVDLSNDLFDTEDEPFGWRVWSVPTQAELDADGRAPVSSWKPYLGDYRDVAITQAAIQEAKEYVESPLTLRDGTVIDRFKSTWSDWVALDNMVMKYIASTEPYTVNGEKYTATQSGNVVTFTTQESMDAARVSVYVNGIAQLKAAFTVNGRVLRVNNVKPGSTVTVIIRKYEPSADELEFDPDIEDDVTIQRHFRQDYEYVSLPVRDREGALSTTVYYFWVKNKTTPAAGKKHSVQAVAQQLRDGPSSFLTFQNLLFDRDGTGTEADPYRNYRNYRYDAITISGLSYIVTKDDTFKLRFTRNFTLRDDPQELDLKNVHTEWALMRPGQKTRVPEELWRKLTDSVAGMDAVGNVVPAIRRALYDERNGTRTQFGFGPEQTLAPAELLRSSIIHTILNTKLVDEGASIVVPDYISFLDLDESDKWFADAESARRTMIDIWNQAKVSQVNEIFFGALEDVVASNYELSDIFKTSRISAYSIKVIQGAPVAPTFE